MYFLRVWLRGADSVLIGPSKIDWWVAEERKYFFLMIFNSLEFYNSKYLKINSVHSWSQVGVRPVLNSHEIFLLILKPMPKPSSKVLKTKSFNEGFWVGGFLTPTSGQLWCGISHITHHTIPEFCSYTNAHLNAIREHLCFIDACLTNFSILKSYTAAQQSHRPIRST